MARSEPRGEHLRAAAVDLRRYLDEHGLSVPKFCEANGWRDNMRLEIQRALAGQRQRISTDFAAAIETATGGAIPWTRWNESASPDESGSHPAVDPDATGTGEG